MADLSVYAANMIGNHMLRGAVFTPPATIYVALFSAATGLDDNNPTSEIAGSGYARQTITLSEFAARASANVGDISFPVAGEDWLEATHFAIVDHLSNTNWGTNVNVLMWDALTTPRTCLQGDQAKYLEGALDVTFE